ncbi:putative protein disulfide isomerase [Trypanosoma cruzi]|nr:putative protein disulfide isomerase [Trypanosoma cruzi]
MPMRWKRNVLRLLLLAAAVVTLFAQPAMAHAVKLERSRELDAKTFHSVVNDPSKHVFVVFYAEWCVHCLRLLPKWDELAGEMKEMPNVVIAHIDASLHSEIGVQYGVRGFPTLRLFTKGNKEGAPYQGPREVAALRSFVTRFM